MSEYLDDSEIERLRLERKPLPKNWQTRLRLKLVRQDLSQKRATLIVHGESGEFRIMIRQSTINPLDFSVILGFRNRRESEWFRIRRYNGLHPPRGEHSNRIEQERIRGFHIHTATLRYQEAGLREDGFAFRTDAFADLNGALETMLLDCGFDKPDRENDEPIQGSLFPGS